MILLLVLGTWMLVLSMVVGLCAAARTGDAAWLASAPAGWGRSLAWEPVEHPEISARANPGSAHPSQSGSSLMHSDGVAA